MDSLEIKLETLTNPMGSYSVGQQQAVAISKAVYWGKKIAILDEPTASLEDQVGQLQILILGL